MVYDRNPSAGWFLVLSWRVGAWLYALLGRIDEWYGATSWEDALTWLATVRPQESLDEVQFWSHGKFGNARIGTSLLDAQSVEKGSDLYEPLVAVRMRMPSLSLWWFRTCSTYGTPVGMHFARVFTDFIGCKTAGHTYIIGPFQSGLHSLEPGQEPSWSSDEGVEAGRPLWSKPHLPYTITCFGGRVPKGY